MSDEAPRPAQPPDEAITLDRRRPSARYVEFRDGPTQRLLTVAAERAYQSLVKSDDWAGTVLIEGRPADSPPSPSRTMPFRRRPPAAVPMVRTTPALARVHTTSTEIPRELDAAPNGCAASRAVARVLASVADELVQDLATLAPEEQAAHSAYRQTLRLAAELEGLRDVVLNHRCADPDGCVGISTPGHLDRRMEDAEVAEVRSVLVQLARTAAEGRPPS